MRRAAIFLVVATLIVSACGSGGAATGAASPASAIGSASQAVSPGPSVRPECPNPNGGECLGPLAAGAYTTTAFQPRLKYTVPSGWDNEEDLPGNFLLLPPGATLAGVDAGTSDYLGVYTQVAPDPNCATTAGIANPEPQAIAACIASRQGLVATDRKSVV